MKLTKKQIKCPYCHSDDPDDNRSIFERDDEYLAIGGTGDVEIDEGNGFIPEENFYFYEENLFKFCPMCGRPLSNKAEPSTKRRELKNDRRGQRQ